MKRRELITLLGGVAAWPLAARAQQPERVRRIGVLVSSDEKDPVYKSCVSAFTQAVAGLGWTDGRNVRIDLRWNGGDTNLMPALAQELVGLQPDIIVASSTAATVALQRETRTIPIVFASVSDPVASGIVPRLDRPSGSVTGFATYEATLAGKWLELLCARPFCGPVKKWLPRSLPDDDRMSGRAWADSGSARGANSLRVPGASGYGRSNIWSSRAR